ncbi:hypothetical protein P7K49_024884 [Saguinus oedipus]|uniref:Secreted protein n=1 Tax=Saguinus oedipus TaxID=9490 RepID=A0ABQ9UGJ2_SAGOE|nr:hypothetical protein P7K49_024884 [Saguinus oedipus]
MLISAFGLCSLSSCRASRGVRTRWSARWVLSSLATSESLRLRGSALDGSSADPVPGQDRVLGTMEFTASPKPQLSSRANAFSIAALMSSGGSKEKEATENTIKPLVV